MSMKLISTGLVAFFLLVALALPASAAPVCSDVSFVLGNPTPEVGQTFKVRIEPSDEPLGPPGNIWGNYTNATLSLPSGLTNTSNSLFVNLSAEEDAIYEWDINSTSTDIYTLNVTLENGDSNNTCENNLTANVGNVTNPNLVISNLTNVTEARVGIPFTFEVELSNTGDENATDISVLLDLLSSNITPSNPQSLSTSLAPGESGTLTFNITLTDNTGDTELVVYVNYDDEDNAPQTSTPSQSVNFTVKGSKLVAEPVDSAVFGGTATGTTQINFTENESTSLNASSTVGAFLNITTSQNFTNAESTITLARYTSVTNGTKSGVTALGRYVEVDVPSALNDKVTSALFRVYYTDAELSSTGVSEGSLKLYKYNTTSNGWDVLASTVVAGSNYVETTVTGFSLFGLFGTVPAAPSNNGGGGGSSGGDGGLPATYDWQATDWSPSECPASGQQTRTYVNRGTGTSTNSKPADETRSCTPPKPACTADDYECSDWFACTDGTQTRTCSLKSGASCEGGASPATSQSCTPPAAPQTQNDTTTGGGATGAFLSPAQTGTVVGVVVVVALIAAFLFFRRRQSDKFKITIKK